MDDQFLERCNKLDNRSGAPRPLREWHSRTAVRCGENLYAGSFVSVTFMQVAHTMNRFICSSCRTSPTLSRTIAGAVLGGVLLCAAIPAHAAKCLPDHDFASYPSGEPGYNRQTGYPYFRVAMNSRFSEDGDLIVDTSMEETAPQQHWEFQSVTLSWPEYSGPDSIQGYVLQRDDYLYADRANAQEVLVSGTTAVRPNHASAFKEWIVYRLKDGGTVQDCFSGDRTVCPRWASLKLRCGQRVASSTKGMSATLLEDSIEPEPAPDQLPYPPGTFAHHYLWNPLVSVILKERRTGGFLPDPEPPTVSPPTDDPPDSTPGQTDTTPPSLSSAAVHGAVLVLGYDDELDDISTPDPGAYSISIDGGTGTNPSGVVVNGSTVTLTLRPAVRPEQTVTVDYTPGPSPVRDAAGNDAAALIAEPVTNNTPAADSGAQPGCKQPHVSGRAGSSEPHAGVRLVSATGGSPAESSGFDVTLELDENRDGSEYPVELGCVAVAEPGRQFSYAIVAGDRLRFAVGAADGLLRYIGTGEDAAVTRAYVITVSATPDDRGAAIDLRVRIVIVPIDDGLVTLIYPAAAGRQARNGRAGGP